MKKDYEKPEMSISEEKKFERVYSGGCTKNPGNHANCSYFDDESPESQLSGTSRHQNLAPGYNPGDEVMTSN